MKSSTWLACLLSVAMFACAPERSDEANDGNLSCAETDTRCSGTTFEMCEDGAYVAAEDCGGDQVCDPALGCAVNACQPGSRVCVGNSVHGCAGDGTIGDVIETCPDGCTGGSCSSEDSCSGGAAEYVYVVDNANNLYEFDPGNDAHTFTPIGTLNCPAGPPLGGGVGAATPFSMSVDRNAIAWVLYSSGEMFHVTTDGNATCTPTSFQKQQSGYDLMGMGFVSDSQGSSEEKLYVSGSKLDTFSGELTDTKLGYVSPSSLQVTHLNNMTNLENPPELTGTGDAKLYGYFPGSPSTISEIDESSGTRTGTAWPAGNVAAGELAGWAFAQWGGRFYVFVTTRPALGGVESKVIRVDPEANGGAGVAETVKDSGVPYIVGAGVSTCAPIVIN